MAPISIDSGPKGLLIRHKRAGLREWLMGSSKPGGEEEEEEGDREEDDEERAQKRRRRKKRRSRWRGAREEAMLLDEGDDEDDENDLDITEDRRFEYHSMREYHIRKSKIAMCPGIWMS